MKFTLKDFQRDAVRDALVNLKDAQDDWQRKARRCAFSLTAVTGAGKTVMAAAAFEALFHGDDEFDFDADPGAVVIWFSDDPSLNEQTRFRLMEASDRINHSDMVVVENTFNQARFQAGKIYFLNTQKFSKNSLLFRLSAKGFEPRIGCVWVFQPAGRGILANGRAVIIPFTRVFGASWSTKLASHDQSSKSF
jgi:hypothetical protein